MRNKDNISDLFIINYLGIDYKARNINIKGFGDRTIAPITLKNALFINDNYKDCEAMEIDNNIFFFVDDKYINYSDIKLAEYVNNNL